MGSKRCVTDSSHLLVKCSLNWSSTVDGVKHWCDPVSPAEQPKLQPGPIFVLSNEVVALHAIRPFNVVEAAWSSTCQKLEQRVV